MSPREIDQLLILGLIALLGVSALLFKLKNDRDEQRARDAEKASSHS